MSEELSHAIFLFDGVCNFCNNKVNFIIRNDRHDRFRFSPLQSETAKKILRENGLNENELFSLILVENGKLYFKSTASLRMLKLLGGKWKLLYALIVVPPFIRDFVYDVIAKNRYKWWGKRETCMVPAEDVKRKFI